MNKAVARHTDESGEIMIESLIIVLMTTFILIFMISVGFLLYEKSVLNTVANETVTEIAQMYKYTSVMDKDITSKEEMLSALDSVKKYRYLFCGGSLEADNVAKADNYSITRLAKTSFATEEGVPTIEVNTIRSDIGRRYIEVTIEARYSIFWGGALEAFGMDSAYTVTSTAYAECNDISNYYNTVSFVKNACDKISDDTAIGGLLNSAISLFKGIFG